MVADAEACGVVTTPGWIGKVREAVAGIDSVRFVISTEDAGGDVRSLDINISGFERGDIE